MANITAQILVKDPKGFSGHFDAFSKVQLSEGGRPLWVSRRPIHPDMNMRRFSWIPTVENMLDDALVMLALHILEDEQLTATVQDFMQGRRYKSLLLYEDLTDQQRKILYEQCKAISFAEEVMVVVFHDSSVQSCLSTLQDYQMDFQVLTPSYRRSRRVWGGGISIKGRLDALPYGESVSPVLRSPSFLINKD